MLVLFNLRKERIHTFKNYERLYHHLENLENGKEKRKWAFARHPWRRVMSFYRYVRNQKLAPYMIPFEQGLEQALRQAAGTARKEAHARYGIDILEIVSGDVQNPRLIPLTPDVGVEALRREWCEEYCRSHGYALVEVSSPADLRRIKEQIGGTHGHAGQ